MASFIVSKDVSQLLLTSQVLSLTSVTVVLRSVDEDFEVDEDFIGLYTVPSIDAGTLVAVIKDTLARLNLPISKLRGQCYDGCSTTSGHRSGVAKQIQVEEPRAIFTHCYTHSLNLAASDSVKKSKFMKSALETTHEITKLIKLSPPREALFREIQQESELASETSSTSIKLLCPTRWTVRADSLFSVLSNYSDLLSTWETAAELVRDTETKARIHGVASQMNIFQFLFGVFLGELILRHTDNLSKTLQDRACSAAEGKKIADMVVHTLSTLRSDDSFDLFWMKVLKRSESYDLEPELPRQRKRPRRYEVGEADNEFHDSPKAYFRQHYYEAIDLAVNSIIDRFQQPGYLVYRNLEQLLLKSSLGEDYTNEFEFVCQFYKKDIQPEVLRAQLLTFGVEFQRARGNQEQGQRVDIFDIKHYFNSLTSAQRLLLSQVCVVVKLILIMPATNSTSERSFSALRRVKSYLRNTMSQQRLNNLMVLHVHKDFTDGIDLTDVATKFIGDSEHRLKVFGSF